MKEAGFFPHTSQSGSAFKGRSTDADAEEAGADADATAEEAGADTDVDADSDADLDTGADASGEGGVGEEGTDNDGIVEVDGTVAALDGFPPFFFVMGWCVGLLEARWAVAGTSAVSVPRTRRPSAQGQGLMGGAGSGGEID